MKAAIVGVVALLVGLGIGFGLSVPKTNALRAKLEKAEERVASLQSEAEANERALAELRADFDRVRRELASAQAAPTPEPAMEETEAAPPAMDASELFSQLAQALGEEEGDGPGRFGRRPGDGEGRGDGEEDEATREERRRAYMDAFRQRMSDFLTERIDASTDAAEKQRIASIGEYAQSLMEQRRLLRDAETEEERRVVFETMQQNADVLRSMVEEQQDQVMRDSLERQGITSTSEQDAIISAYKESQEDPFFRGPFSFFGGGYSGYGMRGRGGGGRGGPPG